jgi:pyrimidine operon attenuation protein/uracil phosphoribosyltransferase
LKSAGNTIYLSNLVGMQPRVILDSKKFSLTIERLCHQLIENHKHFENTCIIGIQPRGIFLSNRIVSRLHKIDKTLQIKHGLLDITFYRDDFRRREKPLTPSTTKIDFSIENKKVVLIDDVLFTGRTIRAALDALLDFGRPAHVELLVLIDRRFTRDLPIQADYVGKTIDSIESEHVKVEWQERDGADTIWILTENEKKQ